MENIKEELKEIDLEKVNGGCSDGLQESNVFKAYSRDGVIIVEFSDQIAHEVKVVDLANQVVANKIILIAAAIPVHQNGLYLVEVEGFTTVKVNVQ